MSGDSEEAELTSPLLTTGDIKAIFESIFEEGLNQKAKERGKG